MQKTYNTIAITLGDPAGIGPEIALKALILRNHTLDTRLFIIGDLTVLEEAAKKLEIDIDFNCIESPAGIIVGKVNVLDMKQISIEDFETGKASARCGKASYAYILKAIELAKSGTIDAVVTNPINKASLKDAGINFPGHTEIFASETRTKKYSMLFMLDDIAVVHVTTHVSLRRAIELISWERVFNTIVLLDKFLKNIGVESPRIAVGGLNPHAGEGGLFGDEEIRYIIPAVEEASSRTINVTGPYPPDTVFMRAFKGEFDGVVAMLHDHGFVALKSRNFDEGVNITIGLPIIRTSVGHGTAFDIAGKGIASEKSLLSAIRIAGLLAGKKQKLLT
ncbi:MAG: 4-hydroxythreonine-4-phosphate dehydrogenase PdxA [Chitinivibrionales bacterium]|nr:4-hydroxythreonine-4-phosphate dehydrogenase PdxA [Chitinivibrionales bacterium]